MRGDFGTTITGQPIADELGRRVGVSLRLLVIGSVLGTLIGVVVGAWGAIRQYHLSPTASSRWLRCCLLSTPTFVIANLVDAGALRVNSILGVQLFEYIGETSPDAVGGWWNQFVDRVQHLVLPTFTLALMAHRRLQPLPTQRDARRARPGLHPHRAREGSDPAPGAVQARPAHRADPDGHAVRLRRRADWSPAPCSPRRSSAGTAWASGWCRASRPRTPTSSPPITVFTGAADAACRPAVRRHLRGARPEGEGAMSEPVTTESATIGQVRPGCAEVRLATHPGVAPVPAQQARRGRARAARAASRRLLRAPAAAAVQLHRSGLLRAAAAAEHRRTGSAPTAIGQDLLAQTLRGMQKSMLIGVCVAFISTIIAATVGAIAGYFGGWRDRTLMWIVDLLLVVPSFILIAIVTPRLGLWRSRLLADRAALRVRLDDQLAHRARYDDEPAGARIRRGRKVHGRQQTGGSSSGTSCRMSRRSSSSTPRSTSAWRSWPKPGSASSVSASSRPMCRWAR